MAAVVTANGRRIHYDDAGSGPPLVLLGGSGDARGRWFDTIASLSASYRCLAPDLRDAGEQDPETAPYTIADLADDVVAFLAALGIARAHIMGFSLGGLIAQRLVLDHPDAVDRLVLVGTTPVIPAGLSPPDPAEWIADPIERVRQEMPQRVAPGFFDTRPARLEELALQDRNNRLTFEGLVRQFEAIFGFGDVRARLPEIGVPTLVIHGDRDPIVPLHLGEELVAGIPRARLVVLPGVGHHPPRERPEAFCQLVRAFLT